MTHQERLQILYREFPDLDDFLIELMLTDENNPLETIATNIERVFDDEF